MNEQLDEEIWKDIDDFEGMYQISNLGRVRSLSRVAAASGGQKVDRPVRERILKAGKDNNVYLSKDGVSYAKSVRSLLRKYFPDSPLLQKICAECGMTFTPRYRGQKYCDRVHYRTCVVCGKQFVAEMPHLLSNHLDVCSQKCLEAHRGTTFKESIKDKYTCICKLCGREFFSANRNASICPDAHYRVCPICGKKFSLTHQQAVSGTQCCSEECRYKLMVSSYKQNLDSHMSKAQNTLNRRYGVKYTWQVPGVKDKAQQTMMERYGVEYFAQSPEFVNRCIETNRERYGADWSAQTERHKELTRKRCLEKYGVNNPSKSRFGIKDRMRDPSLFSNWWEFRSNPDSFVSKNFPDRKPTLYDIQEKCGVLASSIGYFLTTVDKQNLVQFSYSSMEDQVYGFLQDIGVTDEIVRTTRKVITPLELDLYIPERHIAIECNPTCAHNSSNSIFEDRPKSPGYHQRKTQLCEDQGVFLFHIFGYEWEHKRPIIESMLRNLFGKNIIKIGARCCNIREVSDSESRIFLNSNHRQGYASSPIRLGLYYHEELLSLMTFGRPRNSISSNADFELVRFCNKLNTSVVGGASKLFTYFLSTHKEAKTIVSYSDRAHTQGNLYRTLGFTVLGRSQPGYVWVDEKSDTAYNRVNAQKRNICDFLNDNDIDLHQSETQIMESHGFVKVFDSGTITWKYNR